MATQTTEVAAATMTLSNPTDGTGSIYQPGRIECKYRKRKGRGCWVTYPKEAQAASNEVEGSQDHSQQPTEVTSQPAANETEGSHGHSQQPTEVTSQPASNEDEGSHGHSQQPTEVTSQPAANETEGSQDHSQQSTEVTSQPAANETEGSHGHSQQPTEVISQPASNEAEDSQGHSQQLMEATSQPASNKTEGFQCYSQQPTEVTCQGDAFTLIAKIENKKVENSRSKNIQSKSDRSESLSTKKIERLKRFKKHYKWKKSAAHKYFPYHGPVKNRNLLSPRSCAPPPYWGLSYWDKKGNRAINDDGTPYKADTKYSTFDEYFNKLPTELRLMVISMSLEDRRVTIKLQTGVCDSSDPKGSGCIPQKWIPLIQPPSALFVNKEFREVALKKYKNFFGVSKKIFGANESKSYPRPRAEPKIPFCWRSDTVVLELPCKDWLPNVVKELQQRDRERITKLAVHFEAALPDSRMDDDAGDVDPWAFHRVIAMFPRLVQLDLLVPDSIDRWNHHLRQWKEENFNHGHMVTQALYRFKEYSAREDVHPIDPAWKPPFTIRTVQLLADGQPQYWGAEELFLERKKLREEGASMAEINIWEKQVMDGRWGWW